MKKRILIVSSELLSPENKLESTFELSQAQILQPDFDVSILSVRVHPSYKQLFFSFAKSIVFLYPRKEIIKRTRNFLHASGRLFTGIHWCDVWNIEGVSVFEGHYQPLRRTSGSEDVISYWLKAGRNGWRRYVRENGKPDLLHAHGRFLIAGIFADLIREKHNIPYVYTEHSSRFPSGFVPAESIPYLNKVIDNCVLYIAVSRPLLHKVCETLDREIEHAVVVPNVVDLIFQEPLSAPIPSTPFVFVNVANLEHRKGIDILLRAFKRAFHADPAYRLKIIGEGPLRNDLEALRDYLGLRETVQFLGFATKPEVFNQLEQSHVFVFPSRFETFGVAVIEAMARGLPVISTICGGPENIIKKDHGILIETEHENQLVDALLDIIQLYPEFDRSAIHNYTLNRFGSESFLTYMSAVYNRLPVSGSSLQVATLPK